MPLSLRILTIATTTCVALTLPVLAQTVVLSNISATTVLNSSISYEILQTVYVLPGAHLTIPAGTVITFGPDGALVVARGGRITAKGEPDLPIICTSLADRATWTGGDPQTPTYRRNAGGEWGGIAILGEAYVSEDSVPGNLPAPNATNYGLTPGIDAPTPGSSLHHYGGGDDLDDSGVLSYIQIRYAGRRGATPMPALTLAGVGQMTRVDHIGITNARHDGLAIFGGTASVRYLRIDSAGDDCIDIDSGWRGTAQYGLIIQGFNVLGPQGAGFGDNCIEVDGANNSFWQPVTTGLISHFTVVGAPHPTNGASGGDHAIAFSDNARLQIRNSIFMDIGDQFVRNEGSDGLHAGYGASGTLPWAATWTTPYSSTSLVNPFAPPQITPSQAYQAQLPGNLIDVQSCRFYNNNRPLAYSEAAAQGVFQPYAGSNANNLVLTYSPISSLTRGAPVSTPSGNMTAPVSDINPSPTPGIGIGTCSCSCPTVPCSTTPVPPNSCCITPQGCCVKSPSQPSLDGDRGIGAFRLGNPRWDDFLVAAGAAGWNPDPLARLSRIDLGGCRGGGPGCPALVINGSWTGGTLTSLEAQNLEPGSSTCLLVIGLSRADLPALGGMLVPAPDIISLMIGSNGVANASWLQPPGLAGVTLLVQALGVDPVLWPSLDQLSFTHALQTTLR